VFAVTALGGNGAPSGPLDLLFVDVCVQFDATGACTQTNRIPLSSDSTKSYLWQYDNDGLKLAQLRFYEVPTVTGF